MKICDACHRHVRPSEGACPFCGRSLRTTGAARLGAVVLLGALEAACSSRPVEETGTESETLGTSTSQGGTSTGGSTPGTTEPTTTDPGVTTSTTATATTPATSTGELTSTGDVDTTDNGCSFYGGCPTDFASPFECSPFAQDCAEGLKCAPFSSTGTDALDATKCVPIPRDPDAIGQPCTVEGNKGSGLDSCDLGAMCWDIDEQTLTGECVAQCAGTPDNPECPADQTCLFLNDVSGLCAPLCDPLASGCAADDVCVFTGNTFACVNLSEPGAGEFEPCEFVNGCNLGLACVPSEIVTECDPQQFNCCAAYCDLDAPTCNGQDAECVSWFDEGQAPAGLEHVGVCILPPP